MANYVEYARTNYFKVKDEEAFKDDMNNFYEVHVYENDQNKGFFCILFEDYIPTYRYDDETDEEWEGGDFMEDWVAPHLQEDQIAVVECVGHEKMRYVSGVSGWAQATNHLGESVFININEIYQRAQDGLGQLPQSEAMY